MADESAAAAPAASTTRPEKPDESAFKEEAAKLEKELADLKSKTVCWLPSCSTYPPPPELLANKFPIDRSLTLIICKPTGSN